MARILTQTAVKAILAREADEAFLPCLTITAGTTTYRLVNNTETITRAAGTFQPFSFDAKPPEDTDNASPTLTIRLDNVDREITRLIRDFDGVPTCLIEWVMASEPDNVVHGPYSFSILSCEYDEMLISLSVGYEEDFLNQAVPAQTYNPINSPGLFR